MNQDALFGTDRGRACPLDNVLRYSFAARVLRWDIMRDVFAQNRSQVNCKRKVLLLSSPGPNTVDTWG